MGEKQGGAEDCRLLDQERNKIWVRTGVQTRALTSRRPSRSLISTVQITMYTSSIGA